MPGSFCDAEDILTASDVYYQCDDDALEFWFPSAIAAELPIVAVDSETTRSRIGNAAAKNGAAQPRQWVTWCATGDQAGVTPKTIRSGIETVLDDLPAAFDQAAKLRRLLLRTDPQVDSIDAYVQLIKQVIDRKTSGRRSQSIEAMP